MLSVGANLVLEQSQECSLCRQPIHAEQQMQLSMILIEGYGMCPNCCQRVGQETEQSYRYRERWLRRVNAISKLKGWGWEYKPGEGFRRKP